MLSFGAPTWQASLLAAAETRDKARRETAQGPRGRAATEIVPRLYLTDYFTVRNEEVLKRLRITHVVSVIEYAPALPELLPVDNRVHIPIMDRPEADLLSHLDMTTAFIRDTLAENEQNRVMVHCFQGISRSATVVCAYLMATMDMTPTQAVSYVKAKRGIVSPNIGFLRQLNAYAARLPPSSTKTLTPAARAASRLSAGFGMAQRIRKLIDREGVGASTKAGGAKLALEETNLKEEVAKS
ncbi:phosphatases II [Dentipellis sp. KUC8613]|nr:phosphatases II [Dentipellis sp. KUC8613]